MAIAGFAPAIADAWSSCREPNPQRAGGKQDTRPHAEPVRAASGRSRDAAANRGAAGTALVGRHGRHVRIQTDSRGAVWS